MLTKSKMLLIAAALVASTGLASASSENDHGASIYVPNYFGVDSFAQEDPVRAPRETTRRPPASAFSEEEKALFDRASRLD